MEDTEGLTPQEAAYASLSDEQVEALLMRALQRDSNVMKRFTDSMKKEDKGGNAKTTYVKTARQYKVVMKKVICKHCGTEKVFKHELLPSESTTIVNKNGTSTKLRFETVDTEVEYTSYTSYCDGCRTHIKGLSREELEERYMELLLMATVPMARGGVA